jgi:hypothetical protein
MSLIGPERRLLRDSNMSGIRGKDGVIGRRLVDSEDLGAALQADGETRSVCTASGIRRRSAAWTILLD